MSRSRKSKTRKNWSEFAEEAGVKVRLYERSGSPAIYREFRHPDGSKDRASLGHGDRALAKEQGKALARQIALVQLTGIQPGVATVGEVAAAYLSEKESQLSESRMRFLRTTLGLVQEFLEPGGRSFQLAHFGQPELDGYVAARRSGRLVPDDWRASSSPRAGTIRNELQALSTVCNWAAAKNVNGGRLLPHNPVKGLSLPQEKNPRRPVMTESRYRKLLEVAGEADPEGRLETLLVLAWETGRRINALLHLKASDVLLDPEALRAALAQEGQDESVADHWPQAFRWRPEWDKKGHLDFSPMPQAARAALERYQGTRAAVGEAWLFPANEDPSKPLHKMMAAYYLTRAEQLAGLPKQTQGGWHAFRRAWATKRKHLPVQDVMAAGGWRDVKALQSAYQGADPETTRRVMELA